MPVTSILKACEETVMDLIQGTIDPMEISSSFYTGYGNVEDLKPPLVVVSAIQGSQVYYKSNVYEMFVNVSTKEMAADTFSGSLGVLAYNVQQCFWNPLVETNLNNTGSWNFRTYQCQYMDDKYMDSGDALIYEMTLRIVGTVSGSI